jgi:hypothetical protein
MRQFTSSNESSDDLFLILDEISSCSDGHAYKRALVCSNSISIFEIMLSKALVVELLLAIIVKIKYLWTAHTNIFVNGNVSTDISIKQKITHET